MKKHYYFWWSGQMKQWYWWSAGWRELMNDSRRYRVGVFNNIVVVILTQDSFKYALGHEQLSDPPRGDSSPDGHPVISFQDDMAQWQEHWDRAAKYKKLLVYEFYKKNSSLCKAMDKPFEELASKYKDKADFCKLDVDNFESLARICGVEGAYPTFVLFKNCARVGEVVGLKEDDLERSIQRALDECAPTSSEASSERRTIVPGPGAPTSSGASSERPTIIENSIGASSERPTIIEPSIVAFRERLIKPSRGAFWSRAFIEVRPRRWFRPWYD